MSQRILITGGFGYLGGRIASYLQSTGDYEIILGSRKHQDPPTWLESCETSCMNFVVDESLDEACQGVDVVVHLAALNHIDCGKDPERALNVNTLGTLKLLDAAKQANVSKFIYFSTAHIYASPLVGEITEETLPRPAHPYSLTHKGAEDYVLAASDKGDFNGVVLRLSNGFGYPMAADANCWSLLVNDLCRQVISDRHLRLHSMGHQRRDFISLGNVQRAVEHFINLESTALNNGLFNIGGNWSPRIIEMVEIIQNRCEAVLGFSPKIVLPKTSVKEVPSTLNYSIDKLKSTGFVLKDDINQEIDTLLLFCQEEFGLTR